MKYLITCDKNFKKTSKVANAISDALDIPLYDVTELENVDRVETLVLVGGGPYSGEDKSNLEACIKRFPERRIGNVVIITLDSNTKSESAAPCLNVSSAQKRLAKILDEKGFHSLGEHICLCRFGIFYINHPNKRDIYRTTEWLSKVLKIQKSL